MIHLGKEASTLFVVYGSCANTASCLYLWITFNPSIHLQKNLFLQTPDLTLRYCDAPILWLPITLND
jgi:hypothetical protein